MITAQDVHALAAFMVRNHGAKALSLADRAVGELEAVRESEGAYAWRILRSVVEDMLAGRLSIADEPRLH